MLRLNTTLYSALVFAALFAPGLQEQHPMIKQASW